MFLLFFRSPPATTPTTSWPSLQTTWFASGRSPPATATTLAQLRPAATTKDYQKEKLSNSNLNNFPQLLFFEKVIFQRKTVFQFLSSFVAKNRPR